MPAASDLERFLGFASAFELAYWTDDFTRLAPFLADDARHLVHAEGPLRHDDRGAAAVVAGLRRSVHGIDRRFDVRIPEVIDGPRTREDGVFMRFALELRRAGCPVLRFEGEHLVRLAGGRIALIEEWIEPGAGERVAAYLAEHAAQLRPELPDGSPAPPPALPTRPRDVRDHEAALLRTLARGYGAAKSEQDVAAALALCSEGFVLDTPCLGLATRDRKEAEQQLGLFFAAFPDYAVTLEGVATGSGAVTAWGRARLSWRGPFAGQAPTGRTADLPFASVFHAAQGRLTGERFFFDLASLCEQTGLPLAAVQETMRALRASAGDRDA
jgi:hypothetical protein